MNKQRIIRIGVAIALGLLLAVLANKAPKPANAGAPETPVVSKTASDTEPQEASDVTAVNDEAQEAPAAPTVTTTTEKALGFVPAPFPCKPCEDCKNALMPAGISFEIYSESVARSLGITVNQYPTLFIMKRTVTRKGTEVIETREQAIPLPPGMTINQLRQLLATRN